MNQLVIPKEPRALAGLAAKPPARIRITRPGCRKFVL